ncbi:DNA polymerase lambda-like [Penaeus vannamei]|uniref:DNA polymerase lambda-like n=1 Tax=Penaeus vannamei TaxID=6689 RepID=UPI00387F914B
MDAGGTPRTREMKSCEWRRSMRLLAIKMGMSLSEHGLRTGIIRQKGEKLTKGQLLHTPTEESIFKHLGLDYCSPEERDH